MSEYVYVHEKFIEQKDCFFAVVSTNVPLLIH